MDRRVICCKGVAALELLIVTPVLLILLLGFLSLSLASGLRGDLAMAARAGMQYALQDAASSPDLPAIVATTEHAAASLPVDVTAEASTWCACMTTAEGALLEVDCETQMCPEPTPTPHRYVRITASGQFPYPWAIPGLPTTWQLDAETVVRTQ